MKSVSEGCQSQAIITRPYRQEIMVVWTRVEAVKMREKWTHLRDIQEFKSISLNNGFQMGK